MTKDIRHERSDAPGERGDAAPPEAGGGADGRSEIRERLEAAAPSAPASPDRDPTREAADPAPIRSDGLSAIVEQLERDGRAAGLDAGRSRVLVEAIASMVGAPDGRSALLEQLVRATKAGGDAAAWTRLADGLLATEDQAPEGRSALLQEIVRAASGGPRGPPRALPDARRDVQSAKPLSAGDVVGRFEMLRELGSGGFGVVFEARDRELGRNVAFKTVRPGVRTGQLDAMLLKEAEAAAHLQHENIVSIFDYGQSDHGPYLVLELLRGETLGARLARGPMSVAEAVHVAAQIARALAHAHAAGLLHRDLKPGNVFLAESGRTKVMDLGLASFLGHPVSLSGTPAYMAPEQWRGEAQDGRTDVFALGVTLYEMLEGRRPYDVRDERSTALDPGPEPRLRAPQAPPPLKRLVERCIAKDAERRPAGARAVLEELLRIERELDRAPARRRRLILEAAAATLVLLVVAAGVWWRFLRPPSERIPIAVADFEDRTGDAGLDGLSSLLITSLQESQILNVMPRSRMRDVLRLAGKDVTGRIDEAAARSLGKLAGIRALVLGTLHRFGEVFALELQAIDPTSEQVLFAAKEQVRGKEGLPDLLDRVSAKLREGLRERTWAIEDHSVRLAQAVTPNMEAWQHYFRGLECSERFVLAGSYGDCLADFKKAIALDPGFALAHFQISYLYFWQGLPRAAQKAALEPALRDEGRIPPRDRLRIRGWAAFLDGQDAEAKKLLEQAARAAPDDKFIWYLAGEVPFHRDEFAQSVPFFQRAHDLDPVWLMPTQHLALALGPAGRLDEIRAMIRGLESLGPKPGALIGLCYAHLWVDPASARAACERGIAAGAGLVGQEFLAIELLSNGPRTDLLTLLGKMAAERKEPLGFEWYMSLLLAGEEGRWRDVAAQLGKAGDPDDSWFHGVAAELLVGSGDREAAWAQALRALEIDRYSVSNLAVHLAYMGDLVRAAELMPYLPAGSPRVETYRAVVRWRQGDLAGAIESLRRVAEVSPLSVDPATPFPVFLLGEALVEAGRDAEAVPVLQRFLRMPLHAPTWQRPRALYDLARAQERIGDRAGARESAGRLMAIWGNATAPQPLLAEARALAARLGAR